MLVWSTKGVDLKFNFSHQDTFSLSFGPVDENLLNFSCSFSHLLVLVTQVSHQKNKMPANDITKYRVRRNHTVHSTQYVSAEQHAHFRSQLRPADEK